MDISRYQVIGIGEFSHGIQDSWEYRFRLLKYAIKYTSKKIVVFSEMSTWQAKNVMNRTVYNRETGRYDEHKGFKKEPEVRGDGKSPIWGPYWQYISHSMEGDIVMRIFKYIREHDDRIELIGVDNDKLDRDYDMAKIILNRYRPRSVNFFWAHNAHVSTMPLSSYNRKYIANESHRWYCGYYLRKALGDKYCIVLSQAYQGKQRFNSYCSNKTCRVREWGDYFYEEFKWLPARRYMDGLIPGSDYTAPIVGFSNSFFYGSKYGMATVWKKVDADYILFWSKVSSL